MLDNFKTKVNHMYNTVIDYNDIKNIPDRNKLLDETLYKSITYKISKIQDLLFMPNDLHELKLNDPTIKKNVYKLVIFGVFLDGRKAVVVINGVVPYCEMVLNDNNASDIFESLKEVIHEGNKIDTKPIKYELFNAKTFKGFQKDKKSFVRFYFHDTWFRKLAINHLISKGYETTSDDLSCYYRVFCRDNLTSISSWITLKNYYVKNYPSIKGNVFEVNIKDYVMFDGDISNDIRMANDNTMTCCYDIETYNPTGILPLPENEDSLMFMISLTFQWHHSTDALIKICLVDLPCDPDPDYLTVICHTEENLIKAFGRIMGKMNPDIVMGFNDSEYDWPWIINRSLKYKGVLRFLLKQMNNFNPWGEDDKSEQELRDKYFRTERIKLESEIYMDGKYFKMPGYICIDVRCMFRLLYPTVERSRLNDYLGLNNLSSKEDMPIVELFEIYRQLDALMKEPINNEPIHNEPIEKEEEKEYINNEPIEKEEEKEYINNDKLIKIESINNDKLIKIESINNNESIHNEPIEKEPYQMRLNKLKGRMAKVAKYCIVDSFKCHELMKIRSVIMDKREISKLSYTSVFDAIYRANGMKVRNMVIARGQLDGVRFSNIPPTGHLEEGKYPGAFVISPTKGLVTSKLTLVERLEFDKPTEGGLSVSHDDLSKYYELIEEHGIHYNDYYATLDLEPLFINFLKEKTGRPITGLDFSSLYPSLMQAYNLSPDYIVTEKKQAMELHESGYNLHKIKFIYNNRIIKGWSVLHDNVFERGPDYKFGIYPSILKELFDTRAKMKKELHKWESEKEQINSLSKKEYDSDTVRKKRDIVSFNYNYIDSKQRALKVFMNTFYGESGNKRSPFYIVQLAGAVTSSGIYNLKLVKQYVESVGCTVFYGDTDSLYISMPDECFDTLDRKYYTGKIDKLTYWTELVILTFNKIKKVNIGVNDLLKKDNGTNFLKMAYEESLFPVAFLAKKKYYGIPHISIPNFTPKTLFIKGLDMIKRGASDFLKKVCSEIMWSSVSLDNKLNLLELVQNKIEMIYSTKWDFKDFIKTDVYRPYKKNIKIQTFVERMSSIGITIKTNERFGYVIIKTNPYKYDYRGRKISKSIGDKMELTDRAMELGMEIDLDYYMSGGINGQMSRLITYHDSFFVEQLPDEDLKISEDKTYNNACKYIEKFCSKYYTNYTSKGHLYQSIYKMSYKIIKEKLIKHDIVISDIDIENIGESVHAKAEKRGIKLSKNYGEYYIKKRIKNVENKDKLMKTLQNVYFGMKNNILFKRKQMFKNRNNELNNQLRNNMDNIIIVLKKQNMLVDNISEIIKKHFDIDNKYNESDADIPASLYIQHIPNVEDTANSQIINYITDKEIIDKFSKIYNLIVCNYRFINETYDIVEYLKKYRNKKLGDVYIMKKIDIKPDIDDLVNSMIDNDKKIF